MKKLALLLALLSTAACQHLPTKPKAQASGTLSALSQKPVSPIQKSAQKVAIKPAASIPATTEQHKAKLPDILPAQPKERDTKEVPAPQDALTFLKQHMQWGTHAPRTALLYKQYLKRHPKHIQRVFTRAKWFLPHIIKQLQAQNMPLELALLPYVESGFNPIAHSWQGAAGIWQFTRATGKHMGLKINWWYDERRDLEASTVAALKYLKQLHAQTGDWYLALAAYNAGLGNVFRAQRYYARKHHGKKPTSFWQIRRYLPGETQHYVPTLLGVVAYIQEADVSKLPHIPLHAPVAKLELSQQTDLVKIAKTAGIDPTTFRLLNAAHRRKVTPPTGPHRIYLPTQHLAKIKPLLKTKPTLFAVKLQRYRIRPGDSLSVIARRFGTSMRHLMRINHLKSHSIRAGKTLLVPAIRHTTQLAYTPRKKHGLVHKVKAGESLWNIAVRYNLKTRTLAQYNRLSVRQPLRVGQTLYIPQVSQKRKAKQLAKKKLTHTVKPGESLWLVARQYGASVKALRRWNDLPARFTLHPGQKLVIWSNTKQQEDS